MAQHIYKGITPPSFAPEEIGHHYIDTVAKVLYISAGISTSADWIQLNGASIPIIKSGRVLNSGFSGNPKKSIVTFSAPFATSDYAVNVSGVDVRVFTIESKTINGFTINANANLGLLGDVFWEAIEDGEFL